MCTTVTLGKWQGGCYIQGDRCIQVNFAENIRQLKILGSCPVTVLGNLRTTTKFTTTTSVDWERTGTRTAVSAGKRKLKMQSIGRSTTMTLNVNKHVEVVQL